MNNSNTVECENFTSFLVRKSKDGHENENEEEMFQELASEMVGKLRSLAGHEDESLEEHD